MAEDVKSGGDVLEPKDTAEQLSAGETIERYEESRSGLSGAVEEFEQAQSENKRVLSELMIARDAESAAHTALIEAKRRVTDELNGIATATYEDPLLSDLDKAIHLMAVRDCRDVVKGSDPVGPGPNYTDRVVGYREMVGRFNEILPAYRGQAVVKVTRGHVIVGRLEGKEVRGFSELSGFPELPDGSLGVNVSQVSVSRHSYKGVTTIAEGRVIDPELSISEHNTVRLDEIVLMGEEIPDTEKPVEREAIYLGDDIVKQLVETLSRGEGEASDQLLHELWIAASKAGVDLEELVPDMAGEIREWRARTQKTLASQATNIAYGFAVNDQYSNQFLEPGMERWQPADFTHNAELIKVLKLDREKIAAEAIDLFNRAGFPSVAHLLSGTILTLLKLQQAE